MRRIWFFALSVALTASACSSPESPDEPTAPTRSVKAFFGTLQPGGTQFYSFTATSAGTTELTLQTLRPAASSVPALTAPLVLSLGIPQDAGCGAFLNQATVQPALIPQLAVPTSPNTYCAALTDPGNLSAPAEFNIRIEHP